MSLPRMSGPLCLLLLAVVATSAESWRPVSGDGPSARRNAAAIYDPVEERVILFGGRDSGGDRQDLWAFDLATERWAPLVVAGTPPSPRFTHNAVYDESMHRLLIWSGRRVDATGSSLLNDVWALDLATRRWSEVPATTDLPEARYGTAAIFDPVARHLVTFAGFTTQGRFDDTWRFDARASVWSESAATGPAERCLHGAAYDRRRHRMLIYGGQRGSESLADAWALDLATDVWSPLPSAPVGRRHPGVTWDGPRDRLFVFGGLATDGTRGGDLWSLDGATAAWNPVTDTGPSPRDGAVLVATPDRLLLTGGTTAEGHVGDTWVLDLADPPTAVGQRESTGPDPVRLTAWPTPFNAAVTIDLRLPVSGSLTIYDALGRPVRAAGGRPAGTHRWRWDGRDDDGRAVASGVYLAVLRFGSMMRVARLVLLR